MTELNHQPGIGDELGTEAADHIERRISDYCTAERSRIELKNQPKVLALRAVVADRRETEANLKERVQHAPPPGDEKTKRRKARVYWATFLVLFSAGFGLSIITLQPYRMGWVAWLFCGGIASALVFLIEQALQGWASRKLVTLLVSVTCIPALMGLLLMADIRAARFAEQLKETDAVVVTTGDDPAPSKSEESTFFDRTSSALRLAMKLLALAMELAAGVALYEAQRHSASGEDSNELRKQLKSVRDEMIGCGYELWQLENEGAEFEAKFWRDYYRSTLKSTARAAARRLLIPLAVGAAAAIGLVAPQRVSAADHTEVVAILDLSRSEAAEDQTGASEFKKNLDGISRLLANLPAGSRVTILGATANSFSQPFILLQAVLSPDEGYFKERLARGRHQLVAAWQKKAETLQANAPQTDLLGAFMIASELFRKSPSGTYKMLIIFSDMRNSLPPVDFEQPIGLNISALMKGVASAGLLANLPLVDVQVLGANAIGKSVQEWQFLREFWTTFFMDAGATVSSYSTLRPIPNFRGTIS